MALRQPVRSGTKAGRARSAALSSPKPRDTREIPDKLYFRIGEVARLCEVEPYVLRFWETEFAQLKPNKGGTGQRLYRRRDVEMALRVKTLLHNDGYTIAGARQYLRGELRFGEAQVSTAAPEPALASAGPARLKKLRAEMESLLTLLSQPPAHRAKGAVQSIRAPRPKTIASGSEVAGLFDNLD